MPINRQTHVRHPAGSCCSDNHFRYYAPAPRRLSDVCLSDVSVCRVVYIGPKSRTERPRKTKIGIEVAHVTRDSGTTFKVKRSKVNLQEEGAYCGGLVHSLFIISSSRIFSESPLLWGSYPGRDHVQGRRAFAVAGPSVWNSLPDNLRDPAVGSDSFRRSLKTFLFATY